MTDPASSLQKGIHDAIKDSPALASAMGGTARAFDRVPQDAGFPYITISDGQFLDDGDTCEENRLEVFVDLSVWSRAVGAVEAKQIANQLRKVINGGLTVAGWNVPVIHHRQTTFTFDGDPLTTRARLSYRFIMDPAD